MKKYLNSSKTKLIIIVILCLALFFLIYKGLFGGIIKRRQFLKKQYDQLQKELNYAKLENQKLKASGQSQTDEEYLEKESRLSLGMKKEGETVVVLEQETTTTTTPNPNDISVTINKMLDFVKNLFK